MAADVEEQGTARMVLELTAFDLQSSIRTIAEHIKETNNSHSLEHLANAARALVDVAKALEDIGG